MPGFGNLGAGSGWSSLSGFGNGNRRSLTPSQQPNAWTGGQSGGQGVGGWGQQSAQTPTRPNRSLTPQSSSGGGGGGQQAQAASGSPDPVNAYRAAQNMPVAGGYSTVGFDPAANTMQPMFANAGSGAGQRAEGQQQSRPDSTVTTPDPPLDNAQPMPKPGESTAAPVPRETIPAKPPSEPRTTPTPIDPGPGSPGGNPIPKPVDPVQQERDYYQNVYASSPSVQAQPVGDPFAQPANTLQPLGRPYGIGDTPPQWVLDAQAAGSGDRLPTGPPPGSVAMPGSPGQYVTTTGQTWGGGGAGTQDPQRFIEALRSGGPGVQAYLQHMRRIGKPLFSPNPQVEAGYMKLAGLL